MRTLTLAVVAAVLAVHRTEAAALINADAGEVAEAATYLAKYGYSRGGATEDRSSALVNLSGDIAEFQRFAGLEVTGELDPQTLEKMRLPRCGVKDRLGPRHRARRRKRYALQGSRWRIRDLKYKITSWPKSERIDRLGVRQAIADSFKAWSDVSDLTFKEVGPSDKANIEIRFAAGEHGDGDPFDGRGGTLAHAFFPLYGGDAHFDDSEPWSSNGRGGIDLFMTAAHEFGHSLGLSHSEDSRALMGPFYKPPSKNRDVIKEDDKAAIQELYGPPKKTKPPVEPSVPMGGSSGGSGDDRPSNDAILCRDGKPDAMITVNSSSQYRTYIFKGDKYWRLTTTGVEEGYPKNIRDKWDGVPVNLDAAFAWSEANRIYFFKGSQYWRMTNYKMDVGYPKQIYKGFPGIPNNVEGVFKMHLENKLYFFKGGMYWRFEPNRQQPVADRYPRAISDGWKGIPDDIDSVMTYSNGKAYFFKDNEYYRYDDSTGEVALSDIPYPRNSGKWWFGCDHQLASFVTPSSRQGDFSAPGFGGEDALPRRSENTAHSLNPSTLMLTVTTAVLPLLRLWRM